MACFSMKRSFLKSNSLNLLLSVDCHFCVKAHDAIFGSHFAHMADFFDMISLYVYRLNI